MPRILVTEPEYFTPQSLIRMKKAGTVIAKRMTRLELLRAVKNVDALVVRIETKVDRELISRMPRLACVVSATTGLNHIDTVFLKSRHIPVFSLQGAHSVPTAEHALALLFSAARKIPSAHRRMTYGRWRRWEYIGTELTGKTLGILGIGRIGQEVAKRAGAMGIKVIAFDPYVSAREVKKRSADKVSWRRFLSQSDFITLHAPLTRKTRHLFGKKEFLAMKPSLILVNTARGEIIEEEALIWALSRNRIQTAAMDVYPEEPLPPGHALRRYAKKHTNLILTPHLGASTHEAIERASDYAAAVIVGFFDKH